MTEFFHPEDGRRLAIKEVVSLFDARPTFVYADTEIVVYRERVDTERWASRDAASCRRVTVELLALGRVLGERANAVDAALGATLLVQAKVVSERRRGFLARTQGTV